MEKKISFEGTTATSMVRSGPIEGNSVRVSRREDAVVLEACYGTNSTGRGYISVPADPKVLKAIAKAYTAIAEAIEKEPKKAAASEYEPDEVVMPDVLADSGTALSKEETKATKPKKGSAKQPVSSDDE